MKKKILSLLLALVMALSLVPTSVLAAPDDLGKAHVIVENTTFTKPVDGKAPAWTGTLVDTWVKLTEDSTTMSCVTEALKAEGYTQTGAESNYISEINGLSEHDGGGQSGWMGTLNDWFTNAGLGEFTVANGKLESGDEIRVMYTCALGNDLGGSWGNNDTTVKALTFSAGELSPAFYKDTHSYTLKLAADVSSVVVTPTASNKNFQVRTSVDGTEYKRTAKIPVADGTVITVKCGDPSWPSMNKGAEAHEYKITVSQEAPAAVKVTLRSQMAGGYLHALQEVEVSALEAEKYGFTDALEGVTALDALVKAHELVFGDAFTKETAGEYLAVGSTGWISKLFGEKTSACGFFVNQGFPNDGTPSSYGGYNGTMITNTPLLNGDVVDFYTYSDDTYSDYYTWVDAPAEMYVGQEVTATVTGFYASSGYLYKDPASLKAAAKPLEGAKLGWVDPETGAVTVIDGAVTDKNGQATFTVADGFTGYLTAVSNEDEEVYALMNPTAKVKEVPVVTLDLTGLHSAQLASLKLYSYAGGVKGDVDLLAGKNTVADGDYGGLKYAGVKLPVGNYWVQGYNKAGQYNGGIVVTVAEDTTSIGFSRVYEIYATNSGWVENTDYTIDYQVVSADGMNRKAEPGTSTNWGTTRTSGIFVQGDTVKATLTPIGDKAADYVAATVSKTGTQTKSATDLYASIPAATRVTVNAPKGSTISAGTFRNYWTYEFAEAASVTESADGVSATFTLPVVPAYGYMNSHYHFVRVQHPDGVTYWTFGQWNTQQTIDVTREDLHIGDSEYTKTTVNGFDKNLYDLGNVYLTVNQKGYKNLDVGQSFDLQVFRNWQAIEDFQNKEIALPDVHYRVIDVNGNDSDILTINTDANNSSIASVTANKNGTAIVLVTYDTMTHMQGQSSTASKEFSAIWPEFTGVFVVTVGADGTAIETNAVMDRLGAKTTPLDAEHDILYYFDDQGASYSFKPEEGCTVTVARSTVTDKMSFNGFTADGVTVAADGTVTVTGLTTGRHILCVEKDGVKTYQVVTARGVSYDFLDADGKVLPATTEFKAGDKVKLQFHGLVNPAEKLAGIYNRTPIINLVGEDNTKFVSGQAGWAGTYDFNGNPARQAITVTIPDNWTELSYSLTGAIVAGQGFGQPTGAHRAARYGVGTGTYTETKVGDVLSQIPALSLKLEGWYVNDVIEKINAIGEVTLASEEAITAARAAYEALTEAQQAQVTNYDKLTAAEARLAVLKPAKPVEKLIDAIGEVTLGSESAIAAARTAYDNLTEAQQAEVKNYDKLTAAEAAYARLLAEQSKRLQEIYKTTGDFMATLGTPTVNSTGGEWMVIGLARSGRPVPAGYYDNVVEYVKAMADANERLHRAKVTDNARVILALTAIGKDVTNVGGHNLLKGLDNMAYVQKQGINGPIFTLIALDSHNYPTMGDVTREKLIQVILDAQLPGGGWNLSGENADTDMTAMAIQALAPYYKTNETVKAAVDKALEALSALQCSDGGFGSWGTVNSESCAQVIVALTALGIDPATDSRFVKNGSTVLGALAGFYVDGGGFKHTADGERNGMATEQGYYALAAYYRFVNGQTSLYDMSDVTIQTGGNTPADPDDPGKTDPSDPGKTDPSDPGKTDPTNPGTDTPATGDTGVLVWVIALPVALLAAAFVLKRKEREA